MAKKNGGRKIWKDPESKYYYSLDTQHGEFELFNKNGKHLGAMDFSGEVVKGAVSGRKINLK